MTAFETIGFRLFCRATKQSIRNGHDAELSDPHPLLYSWAHLNAVLRTYLVYLLTCLFTYLQSPADYRGILFTVMPWREIVGTGQR